MSDYLVKRLRDDSGDWLTDLAADRIEELEKELEYWRGDSAAGWDKCEEYRNKLAKAVEALERIGDASRYFGNDPEAPETTVRYAHETTRRLCSTTLAELKGDPDE